MKIWKKFCYCIILHFLHNYLTKQAVYRLNMIKWLHISKWWMFAMIFQSSWSCYESVNSSSCSIDDVTKVEIVKRAVTKANQLTRLQCRPAFRHPRPWDPLQLLSLGHGNKWSFDVLSVSQWKQHSFMSRARTLTLHYRYSWGGPFTVTGERYDELKMLSACTEPLHRSFLFVFTSASINTRD